MTKIEEIESGAKAYAEARETLRVVIATVNQALAETYGKHRKDIRTIIGRVAERKLNLEQLLEAAPELFEKPRTTIFHGVKVGYRKGAGKIDWEDDDKVVALIEKHFADQADVLIQTTKAPVKDALAQLSAADLKRLGVTVEGTGDVVVIAMVDGAVEKVVKAFLKNAGDQLKDAA